jgi:hypothetical protein
MIGCIEPNLKESAEWQMELLDRTSGPVFRIRRVVETPDPNLRSGPALIQPQN